MPLLQCHKKTSTITCHHTVSKSSTYWSWHKKNCWSYLKMYQGLGFLRDSAYLQFEGAVLVLSVELVACVKLRLKLLLKFRQSKLKCVHVLLMSHEWLLHTQTPPLSCSASKITSNYAEKNVLANIKLCKGNKVAIWLSW